MSEDVLGVRVADNMEVSRCETPSSSVTFPLFVSVRVFAGCVSNVAL